MKSVKTFMCVTLLCTGLTQAADIGDLIPMVETPSGVKTWLNITIDRSSILYHKSLDMLHRRIWNPIQTRIPSTVNFIAEHKKASLLAGTVLGYAAYKWYNNTMSTWSLQQANGTTMPTCLGGNPNGASTSQPRYDARLHIINTITENAQTLSDMLFSLHNKGTTQGMAWPWAKNTHPQTNPSVTIKAFSGNIECFNIEASLNTHEQQSIAIKITNSRSKAQFTGRGTTLAEALQNLATYIIKRVNFPQDKTLKQETDMTQQGWNALCGDTLTAYAIEETNPAQPHPLRFVCETKVRRHTQPVNNAIAEVGRVGSSLKNADYFTQKLVSCLTHTNEQTQENIEQQALPEINQATGMVPATKDSEPFYDFRYHVEQFVQQNLNYIIAGLNRLNTPTKNLLTVTFRGTIAETQNSFDVSITYFKATQRITLSLKNNQTNVTVTVGAGEPVLNLRSCLNEMLNSLGETDALNAWCGDSLLGLQIQDDNQGHVIKVPTFACTTEFPVDAENQENLHNPEQAISKGFKEN